MADLNGLRVGCAMTGSFCTFRPAFDAWSALRRAGAELTPIMSFNAHDLDTRFYAAADAASIFAGICGRDILHDIPSVEPIGPKKLFDLLIVAPCTGNTLAKIANGVTDTPAALAVKSHLRNGRPVLIAVSTNDALGQSLQNIARLMTVKHIYFVPFGQDDPAGKPNSCVAHFDLIAESACFAADDRQIQPVLREYEGKSL